MTKHARRRLATAMMVLASLVPKAAQAQAIAPAAAPPDLIGRIFSGEFATRFPPPPRWFGSGATYVTTEPTSTPGARGMDVVEYDTATGRRRDVLITTAQLRARPHCPKGIHSGYRSSEHLVRCGARKGTRQFVLARVRDSVWARCDGRHAGTAG
jgi:hypothetical protein